jgi:mannitol/fructose-specific phosphotransferase system IIA component (Ntr-type)
MKEIHNRLIQLQELYFAREEQRILGEGKNLSGLEQSINSLLKKLPPDTADFFQELQDRTPPAIAPVVNETCYGCGIDLPTSLCAELQQGEQVLHCPNCARYLYPYAGERLDIHDDSIRKSLPRLGIERFSSEKLMIPRLQARDPEGVIEELARRMTDQLYFSDPRILIENALEREAIASTAVEHSLAFPHVRGVDTGSLTFALGLSKKGLKFGAPGGRLSKIFFFIVIPIAASAFYLTLLAGLIESLNTAEARKKLLGESEPEEVWKTLKKLTKSHIL